VWLKSSRAILYFSIDSIIEFIKRYVTYFYISQSNCASLKPEQINSIGSPFSLFPLPPSSFLFPTALEILISAHSVRIQSTLLRRVVNIRALFRNFRIRRTILSVRLHRYICRPRKCKQIIRSCRYVHSRSTCDPGLSSAQYSPRPARLVIE